METTGPDLPERRMAQALTRILQDDVEYLPEGERSKVPVTATAYAELLAVQAIAPELWDRLEPEVRAGLPALRAGGA